MIKFIKNLIKLKNHSEIEPKVNYFHIHDNIFDDDLNRQYRCHRVLNSIIAMCSSYIRTDQEDCPPSIIHEFKQLYIFGANNSDIQHATNIVKLYLTSTQEEDLCNKLVQSKEYKDWKITQRMEDLSKDFN